MVSIHTENAVAQIAYEVEVSVSFCKILTALRLMFFLLFSVHLY